MNFWIAVFGLCVAALWAAKTFLDNEEASHILFKMHLYLMGGVNMVTSRDKSWKKPGDPDAIKGSEQDSRRIVFIRHGESEWNLVFNKGFGPSFIVRLVTALVKEILMLPTRDSLFFDSPLNKEGAEQAQKLQRFLEDPSSGNGLPGQAGADHAALRGDKPSMVVSSNLRRALATTTIAVWPRLKRKDEKIKVLTSLQEVSRNVDTISVAEARTTPVIPGLARALDEKFLDLNTVFDVAEYAGNKNIFASNGLIRMREFSAWVFKNVPEGTTLIVGGHSLWFRYFFKTFLPARSTHEAKTKKMLNSGVVGFTLSRDKSNYRIDPDSVDVVYGGFAKK